MIPGMGNIDPKKMQAMMRQLGIKTEEIEAERIVIETPEKNIIIQNPGVQKIIMQGQTSWQITGEEQEELRGPSSADIELVSEKTGKSKAEAEHALKEANNDIAEAILKLSE